MIPKLDLQFLRQLSLWWKMPKDTIKNTIFHNMATQFQLTSLILKYLGSPECNGVSCLDAEPHALYTLFNWISPSARNGLLMTGPVGAGHYMVTPSLQPELWSPDTQITLQRKWGRGGDRLLVPGHSSTSHSLFILPWARVTCRPSLSQLWQYGETGGWHGVTYDYSSGPGAGLCQLGVSKTINLA